MAGGRSRLPTTSALNGGVFAMYILRRVPAIQQVRRNLSTIWTLVQQYYMHIILFSGAANARVVHNAGMGKGALMVRAQPKPAQRGIQSIAIGWRVLDCLASVPKPVPLKEIAERTAMPASKVRFYLVSFLQLGLVVQDPVS